MRLIALLLFTPVFHLLPFCVRAQDSLSVRDTAAINYRAQLLLGEFQDLLNIVSNSSVDARQTRDVIYNSYAGSENKIFTDSAVQIQDDINSDIRDAGTAKEKTVSQYLADFDLFYNKSDSSSIALNNIRLSNVKKGDYLYIKVYYSSWLRNKMNASDSAYQPADRVAEIRLEKKSGKWNGNIIHIGFIRADQISADTINDFKTVFNDEVKPAGVATEGDSANRATTAKTPEEERIEQERQRQVEAYNSDRQRYNKLIGQGDELLRNNDFPGASKAFAEAQDLMPYELYPKLKINQIRKMAEQAAINADELFKQFIARSTLAENTRKYELAKEDIENALAQKPEERKNWEDHLKTLDVKIRHMSIFEDKFNSGLYLEDIKDFDKVIRNDKTNSDYYLGRGKCYDKLGNFNRALEDYGKAIDLDGNNLEALQLRADLYKRNNQPFKALEDYKIYLTIDKTDLSIYLARSDLHEQTSNLKGAVDDMDQAIKVNPGAASLYYRKGMLEESMEDHSEAVRQFTTAIRADSTAAVSWFQRGKSELKLRDVPTAAGDFMSARNRGVDTSHISEINAFAQSYYNTGQDFWSKSSYDSALRYFEYSILVDPFKGLYRFWRGEYYYHSFNYPVAINNYTDAIRLTPNFEDAYFQRGMSLFQLRDYPAAIKNFDTTLNIDPGRYPAEEFSGDSWYQLSKYNEAIPHYQNYIRISATARNTDQLIEARVYNALGKCFYQTANDEVALTAFKNAIRARKDYAEAYFNRGRTYHRMTQLSDARSDLQKSLELEQHFEWQAELGVVNMERKEWAEAAGDLSQSIGQDSTVALPMTIWYRAQCYYQLKDYEKAIPDYRTSLERGIDTMPDFNNELATIYLNLDRDDSAAEFFTRAIRTDSSNAMACYGLGSALVMENKTVDALPWLEKAFQSKTIRYSAIKHDKRLDAIRGDDRFKVLMKKYYP